MSDDSLGGRYKLIRCLRTTNFCETYLAEDLWLPDKPRCVVKKLQPQSNEQFIIETARSLFTREAKVLYRLSKHPQIPLLLAHLEVEGQFYLVQEFIEGESLAQSEIVPGKRWNEEEVISFLQEILGILTFIHQNEVIHQDIKPSNLIRRFKDGKIFLVDFGLAKEIANMTLIEGEGKLSQLLTVAVETPSYIPSEQQRGCLQFNSDIYALGITAIQAITGFPPHQLLRDCQTGEICWRHCVPHVDSNLASILDRMVRNDFRERYKNTHEVTRDLQKLIENYESKGFPTESIASKFPDQNTNKVTENLQKPIRDNQRKRSQIKMIADKYPRRRKVRLWFAILPLTLGIIILSVKIWRIFQALNYHKHDFALINSNDNDTVINPDNFLIKQVEPSQVTSENPTLIVAARDLDKKRMYDRLSEFLVAGQWKAADQQTWELIKQVAVKDGNYGGISFSELKFLSCSDLHAIDNLWLQHSRGHFGLKVQKQIYESLAGDKLYADKIIFQSFALHVGWKKYTDDTNREHKKYSELTFSLNAPQGHLPALSSLFWDYQLGVSDLSRAEYHERFFGLVQRFKKCNI